MAAEDEVELTFRGTAELDVPAPFLVPRDASQADVLARFFSHEQQSPVRARLCAGSMSTRCA